MSEFSYKRMKTCKSCKAKKDPDKFRSNTQCVLCYNKRSRQYQSQRVNGQQQRQAVLRAWRNKNKRHWSKHDPYSDSSLKKCMACKVSKPRHAFFRCASEMDGLISKCRPCEAAYQLGLRRKNPELQLLRGARQRAKEKGLLFELTRKDVVVPEKCPVLGTVLKGKTTTGPGPDSPTLDRIDPSKGYIPSNVRVVSHRANTIKSDATISELELVLADSKRLKQQ